MRWLSWLDLTKSILNYFFGNYDPRLARCSLFGQEKD
jgi:hypothetical protein